MSRWNCSDIPGFSRNSTSTTYPPIGASLDFPVGSYDLFHMTAHGLFGTVWISRGDGFEDGAVRGKGDLVLAGALQCHVALLGEPFDHCRVDRRVDRIAGDDGEHVVECHVSALECRQVVDRRPVDRQRLAKLVDLGLGRVLRGMARQPDFEERARLLEMPDALGCGKEMAHRPRQGFEHDLRRGARDPGSFATVDRHQAHALHGEQGLADRRPTDTEHLHQLAFRGQLVAGPEAALMNQGLELAGHILIELAAPDDRQIWYTYHTRTLRRAWVRVN